MTIELHRILPYLFIALIALPLPILILYYPLQSLFEKIQKRRYYNIVKKHVDDPSTITEEQLQYIFPGKKPKELSEIAYNLQEENTYKDN